MDLLSLKSEMIRNQALLLLTELTKSNTEIKKIVAFQDGFELLFKIMEEEDIASGGIIVQDCLVFLNNLLRDNTANQNHFRIVGCIHKIKNVLVLELSDFWFLTDDKRDTLSLALETVSLLVSSSKENQTVLQENETMKSVAKIVLYCNDSYVRLKAITTLIALLKGNLENKIALRKISFESAKPGEQPQVFLPSVFNAFITINDERMEREFKRFVLTWIQDYEDLLTTLCSMFPEYMDRIRQDMVVSRNDPLYQEHLKGSHKKENEEIERLKKVIEEKDNLILTYETRIKQLEFNYHELDKKYQELKYIHEELLIALAQSEGKMI